MVYMNRIIDETNKYEYTTDIFIHTNNIDLQASDFNTFTNGNIYIVWHDLSGTDPFYLTWKCRDIMKEQRFNYDIFMYIEDDILVPFKAIKYWLQYNEDLIKIKCNLGFLRIETKDDTEYLTDLPGKKFNTILKHNGTSYCLNNINPYCAFWIYNKMEFNKFVSSKLYNPVNISNYYGIRPKSAIGLHGFHTYWYMFTLIPVKNHKLHEDCKIYHMPNNYVLNKGSAFATIEFDKAI